MDRKLKKSKPNKISYILIWSITAFIIFMIPLICFTTKVAKAAEAGISVKEINYYNSTITLQVNDKSTEVYFSDSTKKSWEVVPGNIANDKTITMDISWITSTSNYILNFKGNLSAAITSVTIPKQMTNFKVTFNKVTGKVSFSNSGTRIIEWRKKDSTLWNVVNTETISTEISYLFMNGATVYFRLAPVNGTGGSNIGSRPSKEVSLVIPKKANAPIIKVDGSKFCIPVKKGMAYRLLNANGTVSDWTTITTTGSLYLKDIAPTILYKSSERKAVTLQFRTNATSTAQVSHITTLTIPVQEGAPDPTIYGILMNYTSSSSLSLQVKAASSTVPFEYTIIKEGYELSYPTAKWTAITDSSPINLKVSAAPNGSHIYIRKKSIEEAKDINFSLASLETEITGSGGVAYPQAPNITSVTNLITTAGVCQSGKPSGYLTFSLYSPTSTTVESIYFVDAYGRKKGAVTSTSTVALNQSSTGAYDKYIITTKITSTSELDNVTQELLYANITLANSDTIVSTSTSGVLLYLYPKTVINNPSEDHYSTKFKRIYMSHEDDNYFKFRIDFGTDYVMDPAVINKATSTALSINSIKYNGYTLAAGTDFTVEYGSYTNTSNHKITTATVTVQVSNFENLDAIKLKDQELPFVITLNNGEVLDKDVTLTLISTAILEKAPIAWSITEGSLKETKNSTVKNPDGTTTTITEEVITYTITLSLFDTAYGVSVSNVTWGGISVFGSASVTDGKAIISLSNAKINKLNTDSTETQNIVITLSNGFVIKSGCKLTILNATN